MQCPKCGAQVNGKFCEYSGSELPKNQPNTINSNNSHTTVINNYYRTETPPYHNIQNQPYQNRTYNIPSYQDENKEGKGDVQGEVIAKVCLKEWKPLCATPISRNILSKNL